MDETELRLAAVETAVIHLAAWIDPGAVDDAIRDLEDIPATAGEDEHTIRRGAAGLLRDGRARFNGLRPG